MAEFQIQKHWNYRDIMSDEFPLSLLRRRTPAEPHTHDFFQIMYVRLGPLKHVTEHAEHICPKGSMYLLRPQAAHGYEPARRGADMEVNLIDFMPFLLTVEEADQSIVWTPYACQLLDRLSEPILSVHLSLEQQQQVERSFDLICREWEERRNGYGMVIRLELLQLLIIIDRELKESSDVAAAHWMAEDARIMKAATYIQQHFNRPMPLKQLGHVAHMSPAYFSHRFRALMGKTVSDYLIELRIASAMKLLKETDGNVTDICYQCGFNHTGHFNKMFRKIVGMSPTVYRKSI